MWSFKMFINNSKRFKIFLKLYYVFKINVYTYLMKILSIYGSNILSKTTFKV